ncbi:MAG: FMN-binding protein [Culicoidibacterales bacterium]
MKKLMSTVAIATLALVLTACGASEKTGTAQTDFDTKGWAYVVEVTLKGDDVTEVSIDALPDPENADTAAYADANQTKKSLKEDYGMKAASPIGKEWYEQIAALEAYIVENDGVTTIELNDSGKIDNVAGATISGQNIIDLYNEAVANAQ